ncbi:MAG: glycosyltransferase [Candidatus Eisenbacteria bacterium]|uniref:Glycosyltransferase n=1 Tax=Eiseniibacteriota bacterium TaxID=2212470 RepID=A0A948RU24_UNCEI|nr:glycosyltransferase [Candidatus Eisenbacteria bacterium]MBU1948815.1 glycosyltransferase [Candidatus Eisenbacteria bacterium]MBU2689986.1 glycosyltransferase [Candidatus Eisenbacteria bacterium]
MKFVLVGTAYPLRGGIAQFNATLVRTLRARGHEVHVLTFSRQYPNLLFPGKSQKEEGPAPEGLDVGAEIVIDTINPWTWWRAARRIREIKPDVVFYKYWMPFFAPCFGTISRWVRGSGARIVYICDNIIPHERRLLDHSLTRYLVGSGDAFIVMTRSVEDDLRSFRADAPAALVPHPVYEHFGRPLPREEALRRLAERGIELAGEDRPLILFFGIIRPYKGLDILLRAMPRIIKETGAGLIVGGEFYAGRKETFELVSELGLQKDVFLVDGYVPNEDVGLYVSASRVVVLPYRSATQSGIVQVAFQLECPVIATDVGGLGEMIRHGETGFLVPPEDPAAVADAVCRYLQEGLETPMRNAVRSEKSRFTWARMAAAVEDLGRGVRPEAVTADRGEGNDSKI